VPFVAHLLGVGAGFLRSPVPIFRVVEIRCMGIERTQRDRRGRKESKKAAALRWARGLVIGSLGDALERRHTGIVCSSETRVNDPKVQVSVCVSHN
jgi:hypothetical protein